MPDDKKPPDHSMAPPPMDPFPTYQTPYPRSNKDDENPFILFRRFADEQFSSFFSGFPQLFGVSGARSDRLKQEVDDLMRQRQEWEEGFRKQVEQEMEEMRQQVEKSKNEAWRSMEDAWRQHSMQTRSDAKDTPWWTRGRAARCPALNGQEPQNNADKCPALYDEAGHPRTELDAYNALPRKNDDKQVQVPEAPAHRSTEKSPSNSWFSALGWDGKQKEKYSPSTCSNTDETKDRAPNEKPISPPTTYSLWAARRMQPFDNPDETLPWLMLSPYSPIYLCNPAQSRLFKVKIQDSEGEPFQISGAKFFERWYTSVDEKLAKHKPWADAFEDLLSLQQTGKMVDRDNWNTWRTPKTWIHDMVSRGSLGNRWGFSEHGMLVKRAVPPRTVGTTESLTDAEHRCARWRWSHQCHRRNNSAGEVTPPEEQPEESSAAANATISADDEAAQEALGPAAVGSVNEEETRAPLPATSRSSYSFDSSALSSTNDNDMRPNDKTLVGHSTTISTRTLPDGSIESRVVYKRQFADGTEATDETVTHPSPSTRTETDYREPQGLLRSELDGQQKNQEHKREQEQESQYAKRFPRRIPISEAEPEPEVEHERQPQSTQQQDSTNSNERPRRSGGGWFWN
ncbi:uncharacterized protein Z520_10205 [Fonsecaea multimorphosa CBS 102226]|uniref:Uncharacterized protein n=1 Tax=Fonsecaea multimorphosa CBS 102226 TaxID=1442371 RepID=A0A0D2KBV2_9EURO|nr:uncharacterized protein Z520_10205 [Fonsecaea multimorphosa CBS 102226]KIX94178.1 hypothetical protein Z520_10205 [Fonsecaea multimorphosa CBS 102226]OAL19531.1 hypothetical protein AYO22_09693 [Fonsecaea multimorphosa]